MTDPLTLTKLIILYMLDAADKPLSKSKIFSFIIDNEYTNYFTLMQASSDLTDAGFVLLSANKNSTVFSITDEGRNTLNSFADRISASIRQDISEYLRDLFGESQNTVDIETNYYRNGRSGYIAELTLKDKATEMVSIRINMPTEESVAALCKNFETKGEDIYELLVENLL